MKIKNHTIISNSQVLFNNRGFSLLELILAVAIFSLGSVAMVTMLVDANLSTRLSAERTEALFYAAEGLNATRSIRDNAWSDLSAGPHGLDDSGASPVFSGGSDSPDGDDKYTRVITITDIDASTKNISANITWNLTSARIASVTLETVLTNWSQ
jgi:prepilin-type N-terminal cleavage/methylation domain-containing protein